jgi:hypothetical protein
MSIRLIARELYRLQKEVERLEAGLPLASVMDRDRLQDELRKVRAERDRMKRVMEGSKSQTDHRGPR